MTSSRLFIYLFLALHLQVAPRFSAVATEIKDEVKVEVLFVPENCTQKSGKGDLVNAHYDGYLEDGTKFYCSRSVKDGHPQWFVLGVGQVLKGLDMGLMEMCAGEKRKLTVPPSLAFGSKGKAPVPPNATVIFEVELYSVARGPRSLEAFKEMDQDQDKSLTEEEIKQYLKTQDLKNTGKTKEETFYDGVVKDVFRRNDADKDGTLSVKEYNVFGHDEL
ncbi:peptidyl-prolyl cis-trans isomerase FKBP7 isoform X1 [Alosa alosa]|uniref:peptidyl-prolyl cis-trans isomerase FKBP7 isoform X1 n=1 Tax=Alosa sapidissima TaxID=34773 RepID=UPI001C0845F7|nr:peptidyl-prolyl cis-trans isomerase FKBP7 isoform X1 [Alosa sapidissima]XP_048094862.1 peptidyl-prolyl cis-trans isomerase FKBP7 isoform X1 [Alosa alosa]